MMECPYCGNLKSNVINSRPVEMNVFRIRLCNVCKKKFYTEETVIEEEEADYYMSQIKRNYRSRRNKCNDKD